MADQDESQSTFEWAAQTVAVLKWLLAAAGISGLLLTLGFLVDVAYQHRLGYQLREPDSLAGLALEGGRFLLAIFETAIDALSRHWMLLFIMAILSAAIFLMFKRFKITSKITWRPLITTQVLFLAVIQLATIVSLDLSAVRIHGLLLHGLQPHSTRAFEGAWLDQICSRIATEDHAQLNARFRIKCTKSDDEHAERIEDRFALNLIATLATAALSLQLLASAFTTPKFPPKAIKWVLLSVLLAVVDLSLLPYTYGKTAKPTEVNQVLVYHDMEGGPIQSFLLFERKDALVLFHMAEQQIWVLPSSRVRMLKIGVEHDVVEHLLRKLSREHPTSKKIHQPGVPESDHDLLH